jgi:hypothetical protein
MNSVHAATAPGRAPVTAGQLTVVPANHASWPDLEVIFGTADYPGMCFCQHFKIRDCHWSSLSDQQRRDHLG